MATKPPARGRRGWLRRPQRLAARGFRRIVVFVDETPEAEKALAFACRLAGERHASITAVAVVEVPTLLPIDAHMLEEEEEAHGLLARAESVAESYGVAVTPVVARGREAAGALVEHAKAVSAEVVVVGGPPSSRGGTHGPIFERMVREVLKKAPCRVIVIRPRPRVAPRAFAHLSTGRPHERVMESSARELTPTRGAPRSGRSRAPARRAAL